MELAYTAEQWATFDQATLNPNDAEQMGVVAATLQCNVTRPRAPEVAWRARPIVIIRP